MKKTLLMINVEKIQVAMKEIGYETKVISDKPKEEKKKSGQE